MQPEQGSTLEENGIFRMRWLLTMALSELVDHPDKIVVHTDEEREHVTFRIEVPQRDFGRVIGRQGRTARALRTLMAASAGKHKRICSLDIREAETVVA